MNDSRLEAEGKLTNGLLDPKKPNGAPRVSVDSVSFNNDEYDRPGRTLGPSSSLPQIPIPTSSNEEDSDRESGVDPCEQKNRSSFFPPPSPTPPQAPIATTFRTATPIPPAGSSRRPKQPKTPPSQAELLSSAAEMGLKRRLYQQASHVNGSRTNFRATDDVGLASSSLGPPASVAPFADAESLRGGNLGHLPTVEQTRVNGGVTAFPHSVVMRDIEYSVLKLLSEKVFEEFMNDPLGRFRFREFLESTSEGTSTFDSWLDIRAFKRQTEELHIGSVALSDIYLASGISSSRLDVPVQMKDRMLAAFATVSSIDAALDPPARHLLKSLYGNQFQSFIKYKLMENASDESEVGQAGPTTPPKLGNRRTPHHTLPDHPIVLVSRGFEAVTGYSAKSIIGRNCRFLQGPATSPASVQRIRDALNQGKTTSTLILNYQRTGTAFYNLLCIIPLRDATGAVAYFIGGQVNVTGMLTSSGALSFLVSSDQALSDSELLPTGNASFSPQFLAYQAALRSDLNMVQPSSMVSASGSIRRAAGEVEDTGFSQSSRLFVPPDAPELPEGGLSKMARLLRIRNRRGPPKFALSNIGEVGDTQAIVGAEGSLDWKGGSIEKQISVFKDTYTKVLVFRTEQRRIIFATEALLRFCGLPHSSPLDLFSSRILHQDVLDLLTGSRRGETSVLKKTLKVVINSGSPYSTPCGVKSLVRSAVSGQLVEIVKQGTLHLTPLKDQEGEKEAWVAIFS
ncbi:hypothetical protein T439DRAFT_384030 [Meredithblackwellia eburnea MCA 4105]